MLQGRLPLRSTIGTLLILLMRITGMASPSPEIITRVIDGSPVFFSIPPAWDLSAYDPAVTLYQATQSITFEPGYATPPGAALTAEILPNGFGVPQATNLSGTADANLNSIQTTAYDETGTVISDSKQFYDNSGRPLQSQSKAFYRAAPGTVLTHVLASQTIRDAYDRDAATTLLAPIDYADFSYRPNFLQHNSLGAVYNHQNFDLSAGGDKTNNPDPLWDAGTGSPAQGTLAWYYSTNNFWEPYTAVSGYPYSRQTFYQDGTGNVKKSAGIGDPLKMGTGREESSYVTPVANELDFYVQVRNKYFLASELGALPSGLAGQASQAISHDANGVETITIQDRGGKTLMTARAGAGLTVNNSVTIGALGSSDMNIWYFKLLAAGPVGIGGGTYTLYDMNSEQALSFTSGGSLSAGYYKVVNTGGTQLTLTYSNSYTDIDFYFYDQKGLQVASIAPEGVRRLFTNGLAAYATRSAIPFFGMNSFDLQGRLVNSQDPDRGNQQYMYRKDGKMRFSQNAVQAATGAYSFTNYDQWGRAISNGQYTPGTGGTTFGSAGMTAILETTGLWGGLTNGTMTDVVISQYDIPDNSHGLTAYVQDASNLTGAISLTQRYSTIFNNSPSSSNLVSASWHNYDEEGKATWTIRYINGLGYKTTDYTYDVLGNMTKKVFQAGTPSETFVHYYDYDPVSKQLWHVYTNTMDNTSTKMLQATYVYYLHGGLRRIELAGSLQGIDYTYTLQRGLKAINNSNKNQDPGNDGSTNGFGADAFGEVLDYYNGDYANGRGNIAVINGVNATAITPDSYAGNIKAMSWFSEKPVSSGLGDAPTAYVYQYDPKYQFTESTWGTGLNFANTPATFTATAINKEKLGNPSTGTPPYDGNGNILYLQRTDASGNLSDQFSYTYANNNDQLTSVVNTATSQPYATFTYNANGQIVGENTGNPNQMYMTYDLTGKVTAVYRDALHTQPVAGFIYDEKGKRIKKLTYNSSGLLTQVTFYAEDVIYTQPVTGGTTFGTITMQECQISGAGRLGVYYPQGPIYAYELTDHLGDVRAVIAQGGSPYQVRMYTDYYPYGMVIASAGTNDYRYGYQGQNAEKDPETGWNAFELRLYDSRIARWLQYDPKGQFSSPYIAMGNNPVSGIDKDGGSTQTTIVDKNNNVLDVILDGKTDIIRLDFIDYNDWKDYLATNGGTIFEHWMKLGTKLPDHTIWDFDFMNTNDQNGTFTTPAYGQNLYNQIPGFKGNGQQFVQKLNSNFKLATLLMPELAALAYLAVQSRNGAPLDIKVSLGMNMYSGIRWDDNTVTSLRIAGNILFGKNMESCRSIITNKDAFYATAMVVVGAYNQKQNGGNGYNSGWPFFGEHTLSGNAIYYGYFGTKYHP